MRLLHTAPLSRMAQHNQPVASKPKMSEKAISMPITPPEAAAWVEILIHTLVSAQTIWMSSADTMTVEMKLGMPKIFISP